MTHTGVRVFGKATVHTADPDGKPACGRRPEGVLIGSDTPANCWWCQRGVRAPDYEP